MIYRLYYRFNNHAMFLPSMIFTDPIEVEEFVAPETENNDLANLGMGIIENRIF